MTQDKYNIEDIKQAVETMKNGGVILYPTDTIWGIGCDATNENAIEKIYKIKHRNEDKTMLVLLDAPGKLQGYADVPNTAWDFIEYATRPTTIIYPNAKNIAKQLIAEDGSIGIRITNEPFSRDLCQRLKHPIVSTSANISGEKSAAFFDEISDEIKTEVDYMVKYRQKDKTKHQPSVIIKIDEKDNIKIIRR